MYNGDFSIFVGMMLNSRHLLYRRQCSETVYLLRSGEVGSSYSCRSGRSAFSAVIMASEVSRKKVLKLQFDLKRTSCHEFSDILAGI